MMPSTDLFRRVVASSAVPLVLSVICSAQGFNGFHEPRSMLDAERAFNVHAQPGPQPPCGVEPIPPYPPQGGPAAIKLWSREDLGSDWTPPACIGWTQPGFTTLVTIAARFRYIDGAESLLRHIAAISEMTGLRYWSTTHKQWRTFIVDAYALTDSQSGRLRENFTSNELTAGKDFYFQQIDNLSGKAVYRMTIIDASARRIVLAVENVSTMRYHFIPILHPGELQSVYFLDYESNNIWRFYSIMRTGRDANGLIAGNQSSSINRAVAFYRYIVGIPDTQEPPGAR